MRTLLRVTLDVNASNNAILDGSLSNIFKDTADRIKPEASYFLASNGERSCIMVFDLKDPSDIPVISEPFFLNLNAKVEFSPVMNTDELQKGLKKWQTTSKYIPEKFHADHTN